MCKMLTEQIEVFYAKRFSGLFTRTVKVAVFLPISNGLRAFQWCCSHITLKYVHEKGSADNKTDSNGIFEQGFLADPNTFL